MMKRIRKIVTRKRMPTYPLVRNRKKQRKLGRKLRGKVSRNCHSYVRWASGETITFNTGTEVDGARAFSLDQVKGYTEFTQLYDRYKITGVKLVVQLITNPDANNLVLSATTNPNNIYPKFWFCPDYDDSSATTLDALKERTQTKCRVLRPNKVLKFFIKPAILGQTYRTITTTGYAPIWNQWIDAQDTDVPHYGFKYAIESMGQTLTGVTNAAFYVRFEYKYYLTLKDVR